MELAELEDRLGPFCKAKYEDDSAAVSNVYAMPGHAGFAYGFDVECRGKVDEWFLRLPPPKVRLVGTADVLRQVEVLNALEGGPVPHCSIKWSGDDPQWFGLPYFVVPKLDGDVIGLGAGGWARDLDRDVRWSMARQSMTALAQIHRLDWERETPYLGQPIPFEDDVTRWDRFYEKAAEPQLLAKAPQVREKLIACMPESACLGVYHGDFQWANMFCSPEGKLLAVIDWELTGVGAVLNDVGWIATFNDPGAWAHDNLSEKLMPAADELIAMYAEAHGEALEGLNWFRALGAYKFAIITGLNLSLHRRGKRHDPHWEDAAPSMVTLIDRALELLENPSAV